MPQIACTTSADSEMNWDPKSGPKLDFNEDYYSVLDVDSKVDAKDLKKAYYKLVFKFHPDNIENESSKSMCNKQMMVINGAYRILKNIDLRVLYDQQRRKGLVGLAAGIKESSAKAAGSAGSTSEKTRPKEAETKESPPRSPQDNAARGKKYSGSGFGGSWTASDENTEAEDEVEQEYLDQERERERQRQRYQEPQPQPQTQRERDQQQRDRDREFDFTYKQDGVFETPNRTPWGFNTNTYDEPVRPADRYREDINDINNVEEFLRKTGSGSSDMYDSNVTGLKVDIATDFFIDLNHRQLCCPFVDYLAAMPTGFPVSLFF
jgi:curved DNA-binding protein CbpA